MMKWTPLQLEKALGRLEDALPRMIAEHDDAAAFSAAVGRASAEIEAHAGEFTAYVGRRIDAMLVAMVRDSGHGHRSRSHAKEHRNLPLL